MRIHVEGKAVGCVVSHPVHAALKGRAAAEGLSVAQLVARLIEAGLGDAGAAEIARLREAARGQLVVVNRATEILAREEAVAAMERQLEARAGANALLEQDVAAARLEAQQWREALDRTNDDIAALRQRLAEMEEAERAIQAGRDQLAARVAELEIGDLPVVMPKEAQAVLVEAPASDAEALTPAFIKSCVGFRAAGNAPAEIARLMRCDVAAVRRALEGRR